MIFSWAEVKNGVKHRRRIHLFIFQLIVVMDKRKEYLDKVEVEVEDKVEDKVEVKVEVEPTAFNRSKNSIFMKKTRR